MKAHTLVSFSLGGVDYHSIDAQERFVRSTVERYPRFLTVEGDDLVVDWDPYIKGNDEDRELLNLVMKAAGIVTSEQKVGAYGIYPVGETRYFWGPTYLGERLYFCPDCGELAVEFATRVVIEIADAEYKVSIEICGPEVEKQNPPPLEVRKIVGKTKFEVVLVAA